VDRWERRVPFAFAAVVVAGTLATRYALVGVQAGPSDRYALPIVLWCLALGWWAARARSTRQRLLVSLVVVAAVAGFFGEPMREALIAGGLLALLWLPAVTLPRSVTRLVGNVASASLFVYLTHWQVYPHLEDHHPYLATAASFAVGVTACRAYTALATRGRASIRLLRSRLSRTRGPVGPASR
jgi:hypothetical protein